jgi:putative effector of murein hydrolase/putative effector of murein hydrolase LrgA (UPF0299 family)
MISLVRNRPTRRKGRISSPNASISSSKGVVVGRGVRVAVMLLLLTGMLPSDLPVAVVQGFATAPATSTVTKAAAPRRRGRSRISTYRTSPWPTTTATDNNNNARREASSLSPPPPPLSASLTTLWSSSSPSTITSASSSPPPLWKGRTARQLVSVSIWCLLDVAFRRLFNVYNLSFPSSLAGCGAVVAVLLLLPQKWSDAIVEKRLEPGANVLAQYLPVFFVPSLISLPLADGLGSAAEMAKVAAVVLGGFLFTLWTTAASVLGVRTLVRNAWRKDEDDDDDDDKEPVNDSSSTTSASARFIVSSDGQVAEDPLQAMSAKAVQYAEKNRQQRPVVFSRRWQRKLVVLTAASTALAAASARLIPLHSTERAIRTTLCGISLLSATIAGFVASSRLPPKVTRRIHPLIFTTAGVWMVAALLAQVGSGPTSFRSVLKYCYRGKISAPAALAAGPVLLYLLGPAVVSLSVSMYRRQQLVKDNVIEVATAIGVSTLGGLLGTALAVRILNVANPFLRLSLLSRNITSPLAMAIAGILGADASLAVTMVVVTGLLGANFGPSLLDKWNIKDPVARGLAMGAASHGLGTAALSAAGPDEASAFPFAAIGMALCACASTVAVSVPVVRQLLLQVALGG